MSLKDKSIKIGKKELIIFALLIPFLEPDYFSYIPGLNRIYSFLRYTGLIILIIQFVYAWIGKKIKLHIFSFLLLVLNILPIFRMISMSRWNGEPIKLFINTFAIILIIELYLKYWKFLIRALMAYFEILVYINFITIIIFPNGLYHEGLYSDNWLLGYSNSEVKYLIFAGLIGLIYGYLTHSYKRCIVLFIVSVVSILKLGSVTGIVGMIIMLVLYQVQRKKHNLFNLKNMAIVTALCFTYFIVEQNVVKYVGVIADLTGKTVTFTSRFSIWNKTLSFWRNNPILGLGWKPSVQRGIEYSNAYATNAHNTYLEYLYLGGIIELIIFIFVIYLIYRIGKGKQDCIIGKAIYACIGGLLIMMLTEAYTAPVVQLLYLVCYFAFYNLNDNDSIVSYVKELKS